MWAIVISRSYWRVSPQLSCGNNDKYEHASKDLAGTFTRSKILLTGEYSNWDLVTPTPGGDRSSAIIRHTFYYKRKSWDRLSHTYLTGTTTVRLRWRQPSMSGTTVLNRAHKRESYKHRKMFCNRHPIWTYLSTITIVITIIEIIITVNNDNSDDSDHNGNNDSITRWWKSVVMKASYGFKTIFVHTILVTNSILGYMWTTFADVYFQYHN